MDPPTVTLPKGFPSSSFQAISIVLTLIRIQAQLTTKMDGVDERNEASAAQTQEGAAFKAQYVAGNKY